MKSWKGKQKLRYREREKHKRLLDMDIHICREMSNVRKEE